MVSRGKREFKFPYGFADVLTSKGTCANDENLYTLEPIDPNRPGFVLQSAGGEGRSRHTCYQEPIEGRADQSRPTILGNIYRNGHPITREQVTPLSKRYLESVLSEPYPWESNYEDNKYFYILKATKMNGTVLSIPCDKRAEIVTGLTTNIDEIRSVDIPSGVQEIAEGAFQDFGSLASVTIPEGVTEIGKLLLKNAGCWFR